MSKQWHCKKCGGTTLLRDAYVAVNDPDDVRQFDAVICDDCGDDFGMEEREVTEVEHENQNV